MEMTMMETVKCVAMIAGMFIWFYAVVVMVSVL